MSLVTTEVEEKKIESSVEQMMDWAKANQAKAEQLAMDSARLLSCTSERMDRLCTQGFFKRCWSRFTGEAGSLERANEKDLIEMQKYALSYVNMLQENQVLLAHSMITLKNNLLALSIKEEETRNIILNLAKRTQERFEKLENRVDQLEVSTNLQGWILTLEDCEYEKKYQTEYIRLFKIINDFYAIKNDNWVYRDLQFMRTALRIARLDPKKEISLNIFINNLVDEIQNSNVGYDKYKEIISANKPEGIKKYSSFIVDNISSPIFLSIHYLNIQYLDKLGILEELQDAMNLTIEEALKRLLRSSISNLNINLDYEFPVSEAAIEILGSIRLARNLLSFQYNRDNEETEKYEDGNIDKGFDDRKIVSNDQHLNNAIKEIDISHISDSSPYVLDNIPLGELQCMKFINERYWFVFREKEYVKVYFSDDLKDFTLKHSINIDTYIYDLDFYIHRDTTAIVNRHEIYSSENDFKYIPVRGGCGKKITNINNKWIIITEEMIDFSYTEKGILFNSDKQKSFFSAGFMFGDNLTKLQEYSFHKYYKDYYLNINDIVFSDKGIYIIIRKPCISSGLNPVNSYPYGKGIKILFSTDCKTWDDIYKYNYDDIDGITIFNNELLIRKKNYFFIINNNALSPKLTIDKNIFRDENNIKDLRVKTLSEYNLFICIAKSYDSFYYNKIAITNNFNSWKVIDIKNEYDNFIIGNNYIIIHKDADNSNQRERLRDGIEKERIYVKELY